MLLTLKWHNLATGPLKDSIRSAITGCRHHHLLFCYFLTSSYRKMRRGLFFLQNRKPRAIFQWDPLVLVRQFDSHPDTQVRSERQRCEDSSVMAFLSSSIRAPLGLQWRSIRKLSILQVASVNIATVSLWLKPFPCLCALVQREVRIEVDACYSNAQFDHFLQMDVWI